MIFPQKVLGIFSHINSSLSLIYFLFNIRNTFDCISKFIAHKYSPNLS